MGGMLSHASANGVRSRRHRHHPGKLFRWFVAGCGTVAAANHGARRYALSAGCSTRSGHWPAKADPADGFGRGVLQDKSAVASGRLDVLEAKVGGGGLVDEEDGYVGFAELEKFGVALNDSLGSQISRLAGRMDELCDEILKLAKHMKLVDG